MFTQVVLNTNGEGAVVLTQRKNLAILKNWTRSICLALCVLNYMLKDDLGREEFLLFFPNVGFTSLIRQIRQSVFGDQWREMTTNDDQWREMSWNDDKWREMTWNDVKWRQMTWNDVKWREMTTDDVKWREMTTNDVKWREMTWNDVNGVKFG